LEHSGSKRGKEEDGVICIFHSGAEQTPNECSNLTVKQPVLQGLHGKEEEKRG
jgi:hypothetical protein